MFTGELDLLAGLEGPVYSEFLVQFKFNLLGSNTDVSNVVITEYWIRLLNLKDSRTIVSKFFCKKKGS